METEEKRVESIYLTACLRSKKELRAVAPHQEHATVSPDHVGHSYEVSKAETYKQGLQKPFKIRVLSRMHTTMYRDFRLMASDANSPSFKGSKE
jgi:hypothetical protein